LISLVGVVALVLVPGSRIGFAQTPDDEDDEDPATEESAEADAPAPAPAPAPAGTAAAPVPVRLRQLEQQVQSLKERAWRSKARVGMLKEAVLGGGVGARATIVHKNKMGRAFELVKVLYVLDGTQILSRSEQAGSLGDDRSFEILSGPIAPGNHIISVLLVYRGSGFGPFKYLKKYQFTVKSSHTFSAAEGKATQINVVGYEKGGWTTKLNDRPAVDFRVSSGDVTKSPKSE
jgi:hypothetical protein